MYVNVAVKILKCGNPEFIHIDCQESSSGKCRIQPIEGVVHRLPESVGCELNAGYVNGPPQSGAPVVFGKVQNCHSYSRTV